MAFTATKSRLLISSSDADETWKNRLHRARLFRDGAALQQARALIEQCGDWWRREALVEAEAVAGEWVDNG